MEKVPSLAGALLARGPIDPKAMGADEARAIWAGYRASSGLRSYGDLTRPGEDNVKFAKGATVTRCLTLAPWIASGSVNVCTNATPECRATCVLVTSGKGRLRSVMQGRAIRTRFIAEHPQAAVTLMAREIGREAQRAGDLLVRLNVASDLPWERIAPALLGIEGARFYDYTKLDPFKRAGSEQYRIVYSYSEAPHAWSVGRRYLDAGGTVAVVFDTRRGAPLPETWRGYAVVDGDMDDDRTRDPQGVIVGLRAKGSARSLQVGGFVQRAHDVVGEIAA